MGYIPPTFEEFQDIQELQKRLDAKLYRQRVFFAIGYATVIIFFLVAILI